MKRFSVAISRYKKRATDSHTDRVITDHGVKIPRKYQKNRMSPSVDEKTILYIANRYIRAEYGRRGAAAVVAQACRKTVLIITVENALWAQEVWIRRGDLVAQVNALCGDCVVTKVATDLR